MTNFSVVLPEIGAIVQKAPAIVNESKEKWAESLPSDVVVLSVQNSEGAQEIVKMICLSSEGVFMERRGSMYWVEDRLSS
jgi:hypothetical protein